MWQSGFVMSWECGVFCIARHVKLRIPEADIAKYIADAARLTKEIAAHDADIAAWTGDKNAASKVRQIERADYEALHQDYSESVDALQRAIAVMKKQSHDRTQAALVQVALLTRS